MCHVALHRAVRPKLRHHRKASSLITPEPLPFPLTVGDIMASQSVKGSDEAVSSPASPARSKTLRAGTSTGTALGDEAHPQGNELYKSLMANLGEQKLAEFGLVYKKNDFRAFRFPACADRVVFWASDAVSDRMSFELPQEGYEVNHSQLGSDHRPVTLEVVMRIAQGIREGTRKVPPVVSVEPLKSVVLDDENSDSGEDAPVASA